MRSNALGGAALTLTLVLWLGGPLHCLAEAVSTVLLPPSTASQAAPGEANLCAASRCLHPEGVLTATPAADVSARSVPVPSSVAPAHPSRLVTIPTQRALGPPGDRGSPWGASAARIVLPLLI